MTNEKTDCIDGEKQYFVLYNQMKNSTKVFPNYYEFMKVFVGSGEGARAKAEAFVNSGKCMKYRQPTLLVKIPAEGEPIDPEQPMLIAAHYTRTSPMVHWDGETAMPVYRITRCRQSKIEAILRKLAKGEPRQEREERERLKPEALYWEIEQKPELTPRLLSARSNWGKKLEEVIITAENDE